jgi:hypothetical protein
MYLVENKNYRQGSVLLVVLIIIMVITVLSLGFLSQSDVELACGRNMVLKAQMDYLAESGLEQAKGLILNPQDVEGEYYTGSSGLQLVDGSNDYYNVSVLRDDSDPEDKCNYIIDCNAFQLKNGQQIGQSSFRAKLRLDPCIAFWTEDDTAIWPSVTIHGDVYCHGALNNSGTIDGDVFTDAFSGTGTKSGQQYGINKLSLVWPEIAINGFDDKPGVTYQYGDYTLSENISGMLLVDGNLTIPSGQVLQIIASKNQPALYVTGNLTIDKNADLSIEGLAAIGNRVFINGNANLNVLGGLFAKGALLETACDSSGNDSFAVLHNGALFSGGKYNGSLEFDGSNDYTEVEKENIFDITNQITVSAWIKVKAFNRSFQAVVTKGDSAWRIQRYSNTNRIEFACTGLSLNEYGNIISSSGVNDAGWHHVAGVYDGTTISLYIDGVLDVSASTSGRINTNDFKVMIGENAQEKGRNWNGWIDDVQVYNKGLNSNEIKVIKSGNTVSGLVAHWKFDETAPNVSISAAPSKAAVLLYTDDGDVKKWGQAEGAFYRSIERR